MSDSTFSKIFRRSKQFVDFWTGFGEASIAARLHPVNSHHDELQAFCLFIGYPRSGSTVVGSILDSHPDIVIAHELDVLGMVQRGANRDTLHHAVLKSSQRFHQRGRQWQGYDYNIDPEWQGRHRRLLVMGDKEAGRSSVRCYKNLDIVRSLKSQFNVPLRVIHVIRNPWDNIATMYRRGRYPILRLPLSHAIRDYRRMCEAVARVKSVLDADEYMDLYYDDILADPKTALADLFKFVGVEPDACFIQRCAEFVKPGSNRARANVDWSAKDKLMVEEVLDCFPTHYRFKNPHDVRPKPGLLRFNGRLMPNFLVIGGQRCGSTFLHKLLTMNDQVFVASRRKEIQFFDSYYEKGLEWYSRFFPNADSAGQIAAVGEVSPSYVSGASVPGRIAALNPECKIVVSLRNPVDRIWSAYHHYKRTEAYKGSFDEFIVEREDAIRRGKYAEQIERYLQYFPAEQLMTIVFEELRADPAAQLHRLGQFLDLTNLWDDFDSRSIQPVYSNVEVKLPGLYRWMRDIGQFLTSQDQDWIVNVAKKTHFYSVLHGAQPAQIMSEDTEEKLRSYYLDDAQKLSDIVGRDMVTFWGLDTRSLVKE